MGLWPSGQTATRSPGLPFNGLHPRNRCNYTDYYTFTDHEGMEGWVNLVCWPTAETLPTKWSHVNHRWAADQGKSASQRPKFLSLSHAAKRVLHSGVTIHHPRAVEHCLTQKGSRDWVVYWRHISTVNNNNNNNKLVKHTSHTVLSRYSVAGINNKQTRLCLRYCLNIKS